MRAETESEIASIRNELVLGGFIKKHKNAKQKTASRTSSA